MATQLCHNFQACQAVHGADDNHDSEFLKPRQFYHHLWSPSRYFYLPLRSGVPNLIELTFSKISPSKNGAIFFWMTSSAFQYYWLHGQHLFIGTLSCRPLFRLLSYIKNSRPKKHFMAPRWPSSSSFFGGTREKKAKQKMCRMQKKHLHQWRHQVTSIPMPISATAFQWRILARRRSVVVPPSPQPPTRSPKVAISTRGGRS